MGCDMVTTKALGISWGAWKLGWIFRVFLPWGKGSRTLYHHTDQSDAGKAHGAVRCLLPILSP